MKKILLVAMLFGLMSAAFAEDMTREEIILTLEKNHLDSLVGILYQGCFGIGYQKPKFGPPVKALGEVFSGWMRDTVVMTRIVWVLVPRNP